MYIYKKTLQKTKTRPTQVSAARNKEPSTSNSFPKFNTKTVRSYLQFSSLRARNNRIAINFSCFRFSMSCPVVFRCGNVAAILQLDENLQREFTIFEAAPQVRCFYHVVLLVQAARDKRIWLVERTIGWVSSANKSKVFCESENGGKVPARRIFSSKSCVFVRLRSFLMGLLDLLGP